MVVTQVKGTAVFLHYPFVFHTQSRCPMSGVHPGRPASKEDSVHWGQLAERLATSDIVCQ